MSRLPLGVLSSPSVEVGAVDVPSLHLRIGEVLTVYLRTPLAMYQVELHVTHGGVARVLTAGDVEVTTFADVYGEGADS